MDGHDRSEEAVLSRARAVGAVVGIAVALLAYFYLRSRPIATTTTAPATSAEPSAAPSVREHRPSDPEEGRRARDKMRADILEMLRKRGETVRPDPLPKAQRPATPPPADTNKTQAKYDTEYIRTNFREDMFPLLKSCYEGALKRKPALAGKLILNFTIVGDHDVGGVVEDADIDDESTLKDDEMETCVRESLMTLTFDKPPSGGGYATVRYPIAFAPGPDPEGDAGDAGDHG